MLTFYQLREVMGIHIVCVLRQRIRIIISTDCYDLDTGLVLHRITNGFHGATTGVASQQGALTLQDTCICPRFWGLVYAPIVKTSFTELAVFVLDFSHRITLVTFSILLIVSPVSQFLPIPNFFFDIFLVRTYASFGHSAYCRNINARFQIAKNGKLPPKFCRF